MLFQKLNPELLNSLIMFFNKISLKDKIKFHPHEFSIEEAKRLCNYAGKDFYCVAIIDDNIAGYGILRGWDDGYSIPSLGIYVDIDYRGKFVAKDLMSFLHNAAKDLGAKQIMLKVNKDNDKAIRIYKNIGYILSDYDDNQYIGIFDL